MALFDPARHEPLAGVAWDEARARHACRRILADTHAAFTPDGLWPIHPADLSPERPPDCLKPLYNGAAGVIWALEQLAGAGTDYLPSVRDLARRQRQDLERHPEIAAYTGAEQAAVWIGETGLHLLHHRLEPSAELEDRLEAGLAATRGDPRGLVWGGAGAMLAALDLQARTGDERWTALYRQHAEALWTSWDYADHAGCWVWTQDIYGVRARRLGALHGFLANATALIKGRHLLAADRCDEALRRIWETVTATAQIEGSQVNWPNSLEPEAQPHDLLLQYCHGAPGTVVALAEIAETAEHLDLLHMAGQLIWAAGPPTKPPSLCHGAAGSGMAFLKLFERTGDQAWLDRARAFAMHAIGQADREAARNRQRKFSLWTGDLGLAVFLRNCVEGTATFPLLDRPSRLTDPGRVNRRRPRPLW